MFGPSDWTHIVLNYIGPQDGERIRVYYNGVQTGNDTTKDPFGFSPGHGRVVIGRFPTDFDGQNGGVNINELLFFNRRLSDQDVQAISNMI